MTIFPVLYVLARTDLSSMNSGKLAAQACHCGSVFAKQMENTNDSLYEHWKASTLQGFGTVLVLEVNERQMRDKVGIAQQVGLCASIIHDPTYPVRDGQVCHFIPVDTCGYIFGDKNDYTLSVILGELGLHP